MMATVIPTSIICILYIYSKLIIALPDHHCHDCHHCNDECDHGRSRHRPSANIQQGVERRRRGGGGGGGGDGGGASKVARLKHSEGLHL